MIFLTESLRMLHGTFLDDTFLTFFKISKFQVKNLPQSFQGGYAHVVRVRAFHETTFDGFKVAGFDC
jgi:hypothetical protein